MKKDPTPPTPSNPSTPVPKAPSSAKIFNVPELPIRHEPPSAPAPPPKPPLPITALQEEQIRRGEVTFGVPEPELPLEPSVKRVLEERRAALSGTLEDERLTQVKREREAGDGREKIQKMEAEMAEIVAFLERQ